MERAQPSLHEFPPPRRWQARWIWTDASDRVENSFLYFRHEFTLAEGAGQGARLFITAESLYRVYLNGTFLGEGPPPAAPFFHYYDERDVTPHLAAGVNCLAVIVHFTGQQPDTRGGLLAELVDGEGRPIAGSGPDWRVARAAAWRSDTFPSALNRYDPYQEFFDARAVPAGWDRAGFDDSAWQRPVILRGRHSDRPPAVSPWSYLLPRDIPFMAERAVTAARIETVEESVDLANRFRPEDLSIVLSAPGRPLRYTRVEGAENLCRETGATTVQNSTQHLDRIFDGVYDPCIVLDFGRVITAYLQLDLDGVAGGSVDIGYAERLIDGHFNNAVEGQFANRYTMTDGRQRWRSFSWRGFRYVKLRFHNCFAPVAVHAVQAIVTTYPFEEAGAFHCSDERLNAIFDLCRYTLPLCARESISDTPWREQTQWLGDVAAVTLGGIYACFGDTRLPAKFLRQSAATQLPTGLLNKYTDGVDWRWTANLPDFSLWWVMALWDHYRYTGESRWVHAYYPHVLKIIHAFLEYIGEHGLVADMPYGVFIDWADVDRRGECAALNALLYGALEDAGRMARLKGDDYTVALIDRARTGIRANFVARLFDPRRRCFADANIDGALSPKISEHGNYAAIRWGLCDDDLAGEVVAVLAESTPVAITEAQPFFATVVLQALDRIGRFDLALRIIQERWGGRMVDLGATSAYEEWGINGSWRSGEYRGFMRTLSHAWSAHPAEFLIRHLIGLEIVEPGCGKVRLRPREVPFDYTATFPTPRGPITVTKTAGGVRTALPEGVEAIA